MLYMVTFTINVPPMLAYIPYMDPMGIYTHNLEKFSPKKQGVYHSPPSPRSTAPQRPQSPVQAPERPLQGAGRRAGRPASPGELGGWFPAPSRKQT